MEKAKRQTDSRGGVFGQSEETPLLTRCDDCCCQRGVAKNRTRCRRRARPLEEGEEDRQHGAPVVPTQGVSAVPSINFFVSHSEEECVHNGTRGVGMDGRPSRR